MASLVQNLAFTVALFCSTAALASGGISQPLAHGHVAPVHVESPRVVGWGDGVEHPSHQGPFEHGPTPIDHPPGWHHHRGHPEPLCSCVGIDHVPVDRFKVYQPQ
jgi:hypothetical protein